MRLPVAIAFSVVLSVRSAAVSGAIRIGAPDNFSHFAKVKDTKSRAQKQATA